jgi:hypothetical protein
MTPLSIEEKTRLREDVLRVLANRQLEPLGVTAISFNVRAGQRIAFRFDDLAVREALAMLHGLEFVEPVANPLGGIENWKPTADGILYYERNLQ